MLFRGVVQICQSKNDHRAFKDDTSETISGVPSSNEAQKQAPQRQLKIHWRKKNFTSIVTDDGQSFDLGFEQSLDQVFRDSTKSEPSDQQLRAVLLENDYISGRNQGNIIN